MIRDRVCHANSSALSGRVEVQRKDGSRGASLDPNHHGINRPLDAAEAPPFRVRLRDRLHPGPGKIRTGCVVTRLDPSRGPPTGRDRRTSLRVERPQSWLLPGTRLARSRKIKRMGPRPRRDRRYPELTQTERRRPHLRRHSENQGPPMKFTSISSI